MKKNNRNLKGLTLIELIVVMAIFSILLVAIIQFFSPVERIFKNTAVSEKTYAYTNNIEELLEEKLKYADVLWVFNGKQVDDTEYSITSSGAMEDAELKKISEDIAKRYYNGSVVFDGTTESYAKGKVHILHLINETSSFQVGQITERTLDFNCDPTLANKTGTLAAEDTSQYLIPDAYFKAGDAKYMFHYALGAGRMINCPSISLGSEDSTRVVDKDYNDTPIEIAFNNMNLCIVTNTNDDGTNTEFFPDGTHGITYSAFSNPCTLSVANLPLNNIVYCGNQTAAKRSLKITPTDASGATLGSMQYCKMADIMALVPESFKIMDSTGASFVSDKMDFTNDIYFVFTYADELK